MWDFDNAFDPNNDHLWARCETHERDGTGPKRCIFVENCAACKIYCLHDAPLSLRNRFPKPAESAL